MDQDIRFCSTSDGAGIAYSVIGSGPPLVWGPWLVSHLELEWEEPQLRAFFEQLAQRFTVVRYDRWGCGLSDRTRADFSLDSEVRPLAAVVDHLHLSSFALVGSSASGPPAMVYAARYPERISSLVLWATFLRRPPEEQKAREAVNQVILSDKQLGAAILGLRKTPDLSPEWLKWYTNFMSAAVSPEMLVGLRGYLEAEGDITDICRQISVPTLVAQRRDDPRNPLERSREIAAAIPDAHLIILPDIAHLPWMGDSAEALRILCDFLAPPTAEPSRTTPAPEPSAAHDRLSQREIEVLRLIAAGKSNQAIADELTLSLNTVTRHVSNLFAKTGVANRAEAASYAHRHALV